jgi:hypothetical protein
MSISMYQASTPVFLRALNNLSTIFEKAAAHPDAATFAEARLAPDMLTLIGQVQRASDSAKGAAARLSGAEAPSFADEEKTLADAQARIKKTIDYIRSVPASAIDGSEEKQITLKAGKTERHFTGRDYLLGFAIPNFFFHIAVAYAILRHKGVEIGKMDYLGRS